MRVAILHDHLSFIGGGERVAPALAVAFDADIFVTDVATVGRIVANSQNVAGRVARYLHRSAEVVYPPVDTARYRFEELGDFWLSVNRLSHEKRIELQVEALRRSPRERLVVVGGPQMGVDAEKFLRSLRPPKNVEVLGEGGEGRLIDLYAKCPRLLAPSKD